ncbi:MULTISPECIES: helix-turn-helix domain-containing protein [Sphingobacterium]|jgi:transcriptional regulator with XRE-family HTH domain|uniref:Helix-turn-helix transcriptional regulator n=2 Tax=Sphingobacterium TaxID=28453 RepID=A0ACD5BYI0_9SPHI|nr:MULTISPECIES: helix-turn-helix transcriptional regulator [Sphingobacterium]TWI16474.1 helix-turn-helix protein [Sphingobacterium siyangense]HAF33391.1 XRE family transcriptional regulator [Sphingobacterium sp.]HCX55011.1 XRE family transcriptional regulator [Sphingobacterium sp.]
MDQNQKAFRTKLGKRIEQLRIEKKIEQGELASILNKDKQFINRYERQGANPTAFILVQISDALGVTPNDLLDFSKVDKPSD